MIIITDTNCVIQLFFLVGEVLIRDVRAPRLEIHPYVKSELIGLGLNKPHLTNHYKKMIKAFPVTNISTDHSILTEEKEYLESQYDALKAQRATRLSNAPGNIDLTSLAVATINGVGFATLEHSLLALAQAVYEADKVFTLGGLTKIFLDSGLVSKESIRENLRLFPPEEVLRTDDQKEIERLLS